MAEMKEYPWPGYWFGDYPREVQLAWKELEEKSCRPAKDGKPPMCICPYDSRKFIGDGELKSVLDAIELFQSHIHENPDHEHKLTLNAARIERTTEIQWVNVIEQPSKACRDEWHYRARCPNPECRKWNQIDYMFIPDATCQHYEGKRENFRLIEMGFRVPKKEEL